MFLTLLSVLEEEGEMKKKTEENTSIHLRKCLWHRDAQKYMFIKYIIKMSDMYRKHTLY